MLATILTFYFTNTMKFYHVNYNIYYYLFNGLYMTFNSPINYNYDLSFFTKSKFSEDVSVNKTLSNSIIILFNNVLFFFYLNVKWLGIAISLLYFALFYSDICSYILLSSWDVSVDIISNFDFINFTDSTGTGPGAQSDIGSSFNTIKVSHMGIAPNLSDFIPAKPNMYGFDTVELSVMLIQTNQIILGLTMLSVSSLLLLPPILYAYIFTSYKDYINNLAKRYKCEIIVNKLNLIITTYRYMALLLLPIYIVSQLYIAHTLIELVLNPLPEPQLLKTD